MVCFTHTVKIMLRKSIVYLYSSNFMKIFSLIFLTPSSVKHTFIQYLLLKYQWISTPSYNLIYLLAFQDSIEVIISDCPTWQVKIHSHCKRCQVKILEKYIYVDFIWGGYYQKPWMFFHFNLISLSIRIWGHYSEPNMRRYKIMAQKPEPNMKKN